MIDPRLLTSYKGWVTNYLASCRYDTYGDTDLIHRLTFDMTDQDLRVIEATLDHAGEIIREMDLPSDDFVIQWLFDTVRVYLRTASQATQFKLRW